MPNRKEIFGELLHHGALDESIMTAGKRRDVMTRDFEHLALKIIEFFAADYAKEKVLMHSLSSPFSFLLFYSFSFWEVVRKTTASLAVIKDCLDGLTIEGVGGHGSIMCTHFSRACIEVMEARP